MIRTRSRTKPDHVSVSTGRTRTKESNRRAVGRVPVDFLMNRYMDGHPYLCVALDIGPGGMKLRRLSGPEFDTRYMGLQFQLPGTTQILNASGEAVRNHNDEIAIRFTHVPQPARRALEAFVLAGQS